MKILTCWLGGNDLKATHPTDEQGIGPIANALSARSFDRLVLLNNYTKPQDEESVRRYLDWLRARTTTEIDLRPRTLSRPTEHGEIYRAVREVLDGLRAELDDELELTILLSPGTPAMHAVWLLLAKTRYPAEMIEASKDGQVWTTDAPFEIAVDYIPELYKKPDAALSALSAGAVEPSPAFSSIVHRSAAMKQVIERAQQVAPRSVPVLIEGASGTGKELLARAIHEASPRRAKTLVVVNCGAIPENLIEATLFGCVKGSHSTAFKDSAGYFEAAHGSTLFLDEVGELPLTAQVKLLRAVQEGKITRVGETTERPVRVRIIAATNRHLVREVAEARFREDLFYRLAVAVLRLPPLRDRTEDLNPLIDAILELIDERSRSDPGYRHKKISVAARKALSDHPWPGNVRELQNTLTRAVIWSKGGTIDADDIREALLDGPPGRETILDRPLPVDIATLVNRVKRHYVQRAWEQSAQNKTEAAKLLGIKSYQTFTDWKKKCEEDEEG
jgi:DNA-binding NtrC family response regulator